ncbi:GNAT family N-acetyltransferase [Tautonia marina]|uniref:GNAT family N-acetyltransferase n=1 Tax=Tautonia marina TaxID=2653855 RepID=UPI001260FD84|nr:GNAT family N-acetyltransferase [Tautonia marina]
MTAEAITWRWCPFAELSIEDLYEVMALRQRVFVLEQACPYVDADGLDPIAWHLLGWQLGPTGRRLIASARVFERRPGANADADTEASIGRIVVERSSRGRGVGRLLMAEAIERCRQLAPDRAIRIHAQSYLQRFYEGFGFRPVTAPYLFDGIVHLDMVRAVGGMPVSP